MSSYSGKFLMMKCEAGSWAPEGAGGLASSELSSQKPSIAAFGGKNPLNLIPFLQNQPAFVVLTSSLEIKTIDKSEHPAIFQT